MKYNGRTYHSNTVYMLYVLKFEKNVDGGTNVGYLLYRQNRVVLAGTGFSGGVATSGGTRNPIPDGNYQINLARRGTLGFNDLVSIGNGSYATKPFHGVQEIPYGIKAPNGDLLNARNEWGSKRLYLTPLNTNDPSNENFNYLHGKETYAHGNTTHACVCDRTERLTNYLFNVNPKESPTAGVNVSTDPDF